MPHKEIDIAVEAFNRLRRPLIVVGDGPDYRRLRRLAGPTVQLAGRLPDAVVAQVLQGARALIMTAVEEFGIVGVESQAAGRPVIARRGGGALETVVDGLTGRFWSGGARELARAVLEFDDVGIEPEACVGNAARFDAAVFRRRMLAEVEAAVREGPRSAAARTASSPESVLRSASANRQ
jgi:glycosyltransferase involved in cell wall biosynthesis